MSQKPNIIWLVPDSIRATAHSDSLGRMAFMDAFAKQATEYTRLYTTAPSTFMSLVAALTGISSVFTTKDYPTLKKQKLALPNLPELLKKASYHPYFFSCYPPLRHSFDAFSELQSEVNPDLFEDIYHKSTCGAQTRVSFEKFLNSTKLKEPYILFYHCFFAEEERDYTKEVDFSAELENTYRLMQDKLDTENALVLLHSDHGYPIYRGESSAEFMWSHDMVMTEENIRVPFFLKAPGQTQGKQNNNLHSLIDIFPTLLDILNIPMSNELPYRGQSLLQAPSQERFVRIDNRLENQDDRLTTFISQEAQVTFDHEKNAFLESKTNKNAALLKQAQEELKNDAKTQETIKSYSQKEKQKQFCATLKEINKSGLQVIWGFSKTEASLLAELLINSENVNSNQTPLPLFVISSVVSPSQQDLQALQKFKNASLTSELYLADPHLNLLSLKNPTAWLAQQEKQLHYLQARAKRSAEQRSKTKEEYFAHLKKQQADLKNHEGTS